FEIAAPAFDSSYALSAMPCFSKTIRVELKAFVRITCDPASTYPWATLSTFSGASTFHVSPICPGCAPRLASSVPHAPSVHNGGNAAKLAFVSFTFASNAMIETPFWPQRPQRKKRSQRDLLGSVYEARLAKVQQQPSTRARHLRTTLLEPVLLPHRLTGL